MTASTSDLQSALLAHVVSQTRQNVEFLLLHNHISKTEASDILMRLPDHDMVPKETPAPQHTDPTSRVIAQRASPWREKRVMDLPAPVPPATIQCRALWDYKGEDSNDLTFSAGDIIDHVEEVNTDWWNGSLRGRTGIFPANHVEKVTTLDYKTDEKEAAPVYQSYRGAYNGTEVPPPSFAGGVNSTAPEPEKKKGRFGRFGNTMAHSAAGGVGFGAGAAIGSGIVNAIF